MLKSFVQYFFILVCMAISNKAFAWVYPEHRKIALLAIQNLSIENRAVLDKLWHQARIGYGNRLTESVIDPAQGLKPSQLDYASWTAISGDHSCSPENLLNNVLHTEWILKVADIAAHLNIDIKTAKNKSQHINFIRNSDIRLQRADLEYATRAGTSNVHFLLARPEVNTSARTYLTACLSDKSELNAIAAYAWYHTSALLKASRYAKANLKDEDRSALILAALADEAFGLHFLQDVFAAGHVAGIWGSASSRKGTHDYYNENGLEVVTWEGKRMVLSGDAYMRDEDANAAAETVRLSLEQIINAATGQVISEDETDIHSITNLPDSFNVCKNNITISRKVDAKLLEPILIKTPVPGLATGLGETPRFRSELGLFFGISPSISGNSVLGGFGKEQTDIGAMGSLEANMRVGIGLDGVINQAGDGLAFLQFGWRQDGSSTNQFINSDGSISPSTITSAIPGRAALNLRLRMPFWLIPGDLLLTGPILLLVSPKTLTQMAVTASNGGAIPWQSGMATSIGRFQFVLGREVGVSFYGVGTPKDNILIPISNTKTAMLEYKSTKFDFPIIEYRTLRRFSQDQSSSLMVQLSTGFDIPHHANVVLPAGIPAPELKTVWFVSTRIIFNWRHYLH